MMKKVFFYAVGLFCFLSLLHFNPAFAAMKTKSYDSGSKKILVVYYSRTGNTKIIAEEIAKQLNADIEEVHDQQNRHGWLSYISTAYEAIFKKSTAIAPTKYSPANYNLVIIGTPVWASGMSCAIRTWINQNHQDLKRVAFFVTMGKSGDDKTYREMSLLTNLIPVATQTFLEKTIKANAYQEQLNQFLSKVN